MWPCIGLLDPRRFLDAFALWTEAAQSGPETMATMVLRRQITRCLIAHPDGADTIELAHWVYGEVLPRYARHNVRRHCLSFGILRVGKRSRRFIWALRKADIKD
jgi:hypothetical protein